MYAILISFALAIYTIILVDFSFLHQEISANNDLLTSTQAFYTAEGAVENAVSLIGDQDLTLTNIAFQNEAQNRENQTKTAFLDYAGGIDSDYLGRQLNLNVQPIHTTTDAKFSGASPDFSIRLASSSPLKTSAYQSLEALPAKGFILREVAPENNFNEIQFDFNQKNENSEVVFDIFVFPKDGQDINFQNFETLKNNPDNHSIKRIAINTLDPAATGITFGGNFPFNVEIKEMDQDYKKSLRITGFNPLENNYILHYQTLDNKPIHYKLSAFYQSEPVVLPNYMQTIDLIGTTSTGLYQRVQFQREAEESIAPGLNFVHFSDESIIK